MANKKKSTEVREKKINAFRVVGKVFRIVFGVLLTVLLIGIITGGIVVAAFGIYCRDYLIDDDYDIVDLRYSLDMTSKIYYPVYEDVERTQLVGYVEMEDQRIHGSENRYWAPIQNMPKNLKNAFIAIEDKRFYEHGGFDFKRTVGAALELAKGNKSYGGSTITQQLIKNITNERDSTIQRKVTEISRAVSLTKKKTKDEVLEMYLNTIPLSHGNYGVAAAANYFFDKDVSELTLIECAAIAAIPKSPTKYDPERNPEENRKRRRTVLYEMLNQGLITQQEYDEVIDQELVLNINREETVDIVYSYFTEELRRQVQDDLMAEYGYTKEFAQQMILSGGLQIYATVDPYIQGILEEVYEDEESFKKVDNGIQPESAMVIIDPYTGQVLGIVGGRGEKTDNMTLNRATMSRRQVGSAIKPVSVYAPAMDMGLINYGSVMDDTPLEYNKSMKRYWPKNSPNTYEGKTDMKRALMVSKNTIAAKLIDQMTPQYSYDFLTKELGVKSLVKADIDTAPLALGGFTYGMTTLEVVGCYTMLANQQGIYSEPIFYTKVLDSKGNTILDNDKLQRREAVIDDSTAKMMTKLLTSVVGDGGTGKRLQLKNQINVAAKTGTTNDNNDVYFVGYTPYYLGATWFGYDIPRSLAKFGESQALAGWEKVMTKVHQRVFEQAEANNTKLKTFNYSGLVEAEYCKDSGLKPGQYCELDVRGSRVEKGYFEIAPTKTCDVHYPVQWDTSTGSVACEKCPEEFVQTRALVLVGEERIFKHSLDVVDAQYTIMEIPEGYSYPLSNATAIFENLIPEGSNYGYKSGGTVPANSYCEHSYTIADLDENGGLNIDPDSENGAEAVPDDPDVSGGTGDSSGDEHGDDDIFSIIGIPDSSESGEENKELAESTATTDSAKNDASTDGSQDVSTQGEENTSNGE